MKISKGDNGNTAMDYLVNIVYMFEAIITKLADMVCFWLQDLNQV